MALEILTTRHPIWEAQRDEWARRERLLRGGQRVIAQELARFTWETPEGASFAQRTREASYPAFGAAFLQRIIGHVLTDRPEPDAGLQMGAMGTVARSEGQAAPSQAELVYYNVNGTGGDGQQFWQWVAAVFQRAGATGLRWVLVEAPPWDWARGKPTEQQVIEGQRPYAVELSPLAVTNWQFDRGQLQWCVITTTTDTRRVESGTLRGSVAEPGYYLLVRRGCRSLGDEFAVGGWWKFDAEGEPLPGQEGRWDKTTGEIPMALAVWEWEGSGGTPPVPENAGARGVEAEPPLPLARSATAALDNLSVAYMNLKSAWRSNGWRSAGAPDFVLGVDSESWAITSAQWNGGTGLVGVPARKDASGNPSIANGSAALVTAAAFKALLDDLTEEAERLMVQEVTSAPDASGASKQAGFTESKAPLLTLLAENMESFINTLLRFFELRFGHVNPSAAVTMPREFDLAPVEEDIERFFATFEGTQLRSPTLESEAMVRYGEAKQLVNDDNREQIQTELRESAEAATTDATRARQARQEIQDALNRGREGSPAQGAAA